MTFFGDVVNLIMINTARKAEVKNLKIRATVKESNTAEAGLDFRLSGRSGSFTSEGNMALQSWVEKCGKKFIVKIGKPMGFGFVNTRITDRFSTLEEANKKADLSNYIAKKLNTYCQKRRKEFCNA